MQGFYIKCNCRTFHAMLGYGRAYPSIYHETVEDIRAGKYGKELKRIFEETKFVGVDAEDALYFCPECGFVTSETCLDLYKPKNLELAKNEKVGRWTAVDKYDETTVGELGYWPLWLKWDPRNGIGDPETGKEGNYKLFYEYEHFCPKCRYLMKKTDDTKLAKMTCPTCKKKYEIEADGNLYD